MLTVPTYLDRSLHHGIGLFSSDFLAKGTVVWEFNKLADLRYSPDQWLDLEKLLSCHSFENLRAHSYKEKGSLVLCLDNARFMNHSTAGANVIQDPVHDKMYVCRDVKPGEELLCDYLEYSDQDDFHVMKIVHESFN